MSRSRPWRPWPSLAGLPRNARNALRVEPLWAVFGTVVTYYAPLYMREVGLTSREIGVLGSLTLACAFVFQLLAAPITNRFGRRPTTLVGDLISWTVPMFVWAAAHSFAAFLVAALLSASGRVVSVSWSLLVIEDVPTAQRARVFGILNLIVSVCGLLTPLVGLLMNRDGAEATLRAYYAVGGVGMTVMFLWRHAITQETGHGQLARQAHQDLHPWQSLRETVLQVAQLGRHRGLPPMLAFYVLSVFLEQMALFQILYFGEVLRFSAATLSLVPVVTAVVGVSVYGLLRRAAASAGRMLVVARAVGLVGSALLLLVPAGQLAALLGVVALLAAANFLTGTYRESALFSLLPAEGGADLYSAAQTFALLASVPAGALAGVLFHAQPRLLFGVIALLNVALLLLAGLLGRRGALSAADRAG